MDGSAYFSADRKFRYWLLRTWNGSLPTMANIGANPSIADEIKNDATIRKDIGFAMKLGYGSLLKLNVGAFRATRPRDWYHALDPFGSENTTDDFLRYLKMFDAKITVAAWGQCIGRFAFAGELIAEKIPDLWCFGFTANGAPRHTLMLPYSTPLEPFRGTLKARAAVAPQGR